jgi:Flp pilus assembly protein TadG
MISHDRQRGQSIVIFALMAVALFGLAAIAVDLGLGQADRRDIQAYADSAALAGTRQYALTTNNTPTYAHLVAMQYLSKVLGLTMPAGCTASGCGTSPATFTMGTYTVTLTDNLLTAGEALDVQVVHQRQALLAGVLGFQTVNVGTSARAIGPGPTTVNAGYNVAGLGSTGVYIDGGGTCAPSGSVTGNVYSNGPFGSTSNGHCHPTEVPDLLSAGSPVAVPCPPGNINTRVDFGPSASPQSWVFFPVPNINPGTPTATNVPPPTSFDTIPPTALNDAAHHYTSLGQAKTGTHFNPGTYDTIVPNSSATLNAGVYKIINVASPDISGVQQPAAVPQSGGVAGSGAAVFVFDSSDSGDITIGSVKLNGYEGPNGDQEAGAPSPGTHNFVLYGGPSNTNDPGHAGFQGNIAQLGPADSPDLTGIVYMPNSGISSNGNSPYTFYGAVYMDNFNLKGGGNGGQGFTFICGLGATSSAPPPGSLIR